LEGQRAKTCASIALVPHARAPFNFKISLLELKIFHFVWITERSQ